MQLMLLARLISIQHEIEWTNSWAIFHPIRSKLWEKSAKISHSYLITSLTPETFMKIKIEENQKVNICTFMKILGVGDGRSYFYQICGQDDYRLFLFEIVYVFTKLGWKTQRHLVVAYFGKKIVLWGVLPNILLF